MNGYICFYGKKKIEVYADISYAAQLAAAEILKVKPKQRHHITVVLAEKDGEQVVHQPMF